MSTRDDVLAMVPVADTLSSLDILYYIGGSIASSTHGIARSTLDIDLIADIRSEHVQPLSAILEHDYYVDAQMMRDAIQQMRSFNLIHLSTMHKIDIFTLKNRAFDQSAWKRIVHTRPFEAHDRTYPIASAEDTILSKLEWYRAGGEVSERQWLDVIGVMKVQQNNLDRSYLEHWADELQVADLLSRAFSDSCS